jgi:aminotransferase EvaB
MEQIMKIAKKNKIHVIEDCAQSQGAKYKNKFVGTFGTFGCFSFYPTKILGAYGDGGFILTNDYKLHKKIKRIRFYGIETIDNKNKFKDQYYSNENGINSRLDEIQASILNYKLKKVDYFVKRRKQIAEIYFRELESTELTLPTENANSSHVYHLYTVYHPKGLVIIRQLKKCKINVRVIYPYPVHKMKAYKKIPHNIKRLVNSEIKSKGIFCLPLYPELKDLEVKKICKNLKNILKKNVI